MIMKGFTVFLNKLAIGYVAKVGLNLTHIKQFFLFFRDKFLPFNSKNCLMDAKSNCGPGCNDILCLCSKIYFVKELLAESNTECFEFKSGEVTVSLPPT